MDARLTASMASIQASGRKVQVMVTGICIDDMLRQLSAHEVDAILSAIGSQHIKKWLKKIEEEDIDE